MHKIHSIFTAAALAAGLMTVSVFAGETESELFEDGLMNKVTTEMTDGTMTIRIKSAKDTAEDPDFHWESWRGNGGEGSCVELITESDMEDGLAYAGSFRAIDDGEDTIRLVYTNGYYAREYLDFDVHTEDGKITETTGGGQAFETKGEDLAPYLEGVWEESEGGTHALEIALADDGGLSFTVSDGSGRDGSTTYYTMTAYYDAIEDALVYWDGTEHVAAITGDDETEAESESASAGDGTGSFTIEILSEEDGGAAGEEAALGLVWQDDTFGLEDISMFEKADSSVQ